MRFKINKGSPRRAVVHVRHLVPFFVNLQGQTQVKVARLLVEAAQMRVVPKSLLDLGLHRRTTQPAVFHGTQVLQQFPVAYRHRVPRSPTPY